jgi:MFS family permease
VTNGRQSEANRKVKPKVFQGWIVVAAACTSLALIFAVAYSFATFFASLQEAFGASRADVSLVFALAGFGWFTLGAFTGAWADRVGPRPLAMGGALCLAVGLYLASLAETLWQVYLTWSVGVALGAGFIYVPAIGAVQPWFRRRLGLAAGIASAGIGLGTLVGPLASVRLIDAFGWRGAFAVLGGVALVVGLAAAALLDNDPARRGLHPDGVASDAAPRPKTGFALREAIGTREFRLLYLSILACTVGQALPLAHLVPFARDHGHSEAFGALLLGLIGIGSIAGRFVLGGFGDRVGRRTMLVAVYGAMALLLVLWIGASGAAALALFAFAYGVSYGGFVSTCPPLAADYFGTRAISGLIGALYTAAGLGYIVGPVLAGAGYDRLGSYAWPIGGAAALMLVAVALAAALPEPGEAQRKRPPANQ